MRVADYVMQCLQEHQINHVFTVTGRGTLYLTDALAKAEQVDAVCVHNEQAGAYSAVAYAKCRDGMGAALLTTGCGSTNAISGVLCAWQDEVPCVFISGQNMLNETVEHTNAKFRTYGSQEAGIVAIVKPITKYAVMLTSAEKAAYEIEKAFYMAEEGKMGPVWIDIPLDIQNARIEPDGVDHFIAPENEKKAPAQEQTLQLAKDINDAMRPVVLIGNGIRSAKAELLLAEFVERAQIPVVYSHTASDIYSLEHPLSIGCVGDLCGTRAGNFTMQNADLLIVLGCRMTSMTTGSQPLKFAREAKTVVVDIDADEHTKGTFKIGSMIEADAALVLKELLSMPLKKTQAEWQEKCLHWKSKYPKCEEKYKQSEKVDLYYLAEVLSKVLPDNAKLVCDAGLEELLMPANISYSNGKRCIQPAMQGAMGFALPGAIGAACADTNPVFAVIGDGSIMMNLQELQTIHYNEYPIKVIVSNNNAYAVIRQRQRDLFRNRIIGTDLSNGLECADFKKVAEAFGLQYVHIENSSELEEKMKQVIRMDGAVICEIVCVEEQDYLRTAYAKTSNKKFVKRPLEDLYPFLDREEFVSEMVITPIDQ